MGSSLTKVIPGIYVGNINVEEEMESSEVSHVLSILLTTNENNSRINFSNRFERKILNLNEKDPTCYLKKFPEAIKFIHETLLQNGKVLVNSLGGVTSNITFVIAYLITAFPTLDVKQATLLVQNKSETLCLDQECLLQLQEYESPGKHPNIKHMLSNSSVHLPDLSEERRMLVENYSTLPDYDLAQEEISRLLQNLQQHEIKIVPRRTELSLSENPTSATMKPKVDTPNVPSAQSNFFFNNNTLRLHRTNELDNETKVFDILSNQLRDSGKRGQPIVDNVFNVDPNDFLDIGSESANRARGTSMTRESTDDFLTEDDPDDGYALQPAFEELDELDIPGAMDIPIATSRSSGSFSSKSFLPARSYLPQTSQISASVMANNDPVHQIEPGIDASSLLTGDTSAGTENTKPSSANLANFKYSTTAPVSQKFAFQ